MFKALIRKLSQPSGSAKNTRFLVTKKNEITALLTQAKKKKAFLTLHIDDLDQSFTTALLGVYPDHNLVVLDELSREGHRQFLQKKGASITGRLNGVELRFKTRLVGVGSKSDIAFYKVEMPTKLYFRQQRQSYRVPLRGAGVPFSSAGSGMTPAVRGHLIDLSVGGVGVMLNQKVNLCRGETLEACGITLPKRGEVQFSLQIDFVRDNLQSGGMSFGGHFSNLSKSDLNTIQKYITEVQREKARRSRK